MKNLLKLICLTICFSFLLSAFVACDGKETETSAQTDAPTDAATTAEATDTDVTEGASEKLSDTESVAATTEETTPVETEAIETEVAEDIVVFNDYTRATGRGMHDLRTGGDMAISFTIPEGELQSLYLVLTDKNNFTDVAYEINIYNFDGDYDDSVATEPIYSEIVTSSMRTLEIVFEDGEMGVGSYLVVASCYEDDSIPDDTYCSIIKDNFWNNKTEPEEYKDYVLRSYINGKINKKIAMSGGFKIKHTVETVTLEEEVITEKDPDNVAKVIILSGQSNATGASRVDLLKNNLSAEEYAKYANGFENVKIKYVNGATSSGGITYTTISDGFENVTVGQGHALSRNNFGPELGLAEYLSETYPDETFYIIKYAIGGAGLHAHFNPLNQDRSVCLDALLDTIYEGLFELEAMGLEPKIVSFLWMQGESDASTFNNTYSYYTHQKALVELIRDEFASDASVRGIAFIDAAISNSGFWASWFFINDLKYQYSKESYLNYYIDTNAHGLSVFEENNDLAHYDSLSMLLLGRLFGEKVSEAID